MIKHIKPTEGVSRGKSERITHLMLFSLDLMSKPCDKASAMLIQPRPKTTGVKESKHAKAEVSVSYFSRRKRLNKMRPHQ